MAYRSRRSDVTDLLYEVDEKGRRNLVRSVEAVVHAYVRFTNKTKRKVDVWWRDYRGKKKFYVRLPVRGFYDVNTFLTHPWEFSDSGTGEPYVINNSIVFRAPANIGGKTYRTNWNVTIRVRSLRLTCLMSLGTQLENVEIVSQFCLPRVLADELRMMIREMHRPPSPTPQE